MLSLRSQVIQQKAGANEKGKQTLQRLEREFLLLPLNLILVLVRCLLRSLSLLAARIIIKSVALSRRLSNCSLEWASNLNLACCCYCISNGRTNETSRRRRRRRALALFGLFATLSSCSPAAMLPLDGANFRQRLATLFNRRPRSGPLYLFIVAHLRSSSVLSRRATGQLAKTTAGRHAFWPYDFAGMRLNWPLVVRGEQVEQLNTMLVRPAPARQRASERAARALLS